MSDAKRKLAAIMFTDIVGYTTLMATNERVAMEALHRNLDVQKPLVKKYGGNWLKEMGDGTFISFSTASDAVTCALEIKEAMLLEKDFQIRIGIHIGEVVLEKGDVYGDGVNIASRIEPLADPGQIFITSAVHFNIKNKEGIRSIFVKKVKLKNVESRIGIYSVSKTEDESYLQYRRWMKRKISAIVVGILLLAYVGYFATSQWNKSSNNAISSLEPKSIVVLPFDDFSPKQDLEWFGDGLTEEVLNSLTRLPELRVIARTSSFAFKGVDLPVKKIADSLDVQYLVEGSIRRTGDHIAITVQLINAETDSHIWSKTYDRPMDNILMVQKDIAENIVSTLDIYLDDDKRDEMLSVGTENADAYEAYLMGNAFFDEAHTGRGMDHLVENLAKANVFYDKATSLDPKFSAPHYRHQDLYSHFMIHFNKSQWPDTLTQAQAGKEIHEDLNAARLESKRRGEAIFYELEYATVSEQWGKIPALLQELESNEAYMRTFSHFGGGWTKGMLITVDRADIGLKMHRYSLENDPLNRRTNMEIFIFLAANNELDSAIELASKIRRESGESLPFGQREIQVLAVQGRYQDVLDLTEGLDGFDLYRVYAEIQAGSIREFKVSDFETNSPREKYFTTFIYEALGEQDKADSIAHSFDSQYLGIFGLSDSMVGNTGKIAFNLSAAPNLSSSLKKAGITNLDEYVTKHMVQRLVVE